MIPLDDGRYFDQATVISLPRRKERLLRFLDGYKERLRNEELPFPEPRIQPGVDASRLGKPSWFPRTAGAWGCRSSHLRVIEEAINHGVERLLVFEDDACLSDGRPKLGERMIMFLSEVPEDEWDFLQLGYRLVGELSERKGQFREAQWVVETHAIAYRGASLPKIYQSLVSLRPGGGRDWLWPIDQHLSHLHNIGKLNRFLPRNSLIHQNKDFPSDIEM